MICADSRKHPNEWTFIEELLVELWGISGMRENDTFDENFIHGYWLTIARDMFK